MELSKAFTIFKNPGSEKIITLETNELTFKCPKTGQPDFGQVRIEYVPNESCIELKSFKLWIWSYRDQSIGCEKVTQQIHDTILDIVQPKWLWTEITFNIRGGTRASVSIIHPWCKMEKILESRKH